MWYRVFIMSNKVVEKEEITEVMFEAGLVAWDSMNKETQDKMKKEVEDIYNDNEVKDIYDIFDKITLPKEIILIAFTRLMEEGRIVESEAKLSDVLSIVRRLSTDNERIQSRLLSLAEALKIQKDISTKVLENLKEIKLLLSKVEVLSEIKNAINKENKEGVQDDR